MHEGVITRLFFDRLKGYIRSDTVKEQRIPFYWSGLRGMTYHGRLTGTRVRFRKEIDATGQPYATDIEAV